MKYLLYILIPLTLEAMPDGSLYRFTADQCLHGCFATIGEYKTVYKFVVECPGECTFVRKEDLK